MIVQAVGYAAALAVAGTYVMRTMIPLRIAGIVSNILFMAYGALSGAEPVLLLHVFLLPLNIWRLYELTHAARELTSGRPVNLAEEELRSSEATGK